MPSNVGPRRFENLQLLAERPALAKARHREELQHRFQQKPLVERLLITLQLMNRNIRERPRRA